MPLGSFNRLLVAIALVTTDDPTTPALIGCVIICGLSGPGSKSYATYGDQIYTNNWLVVMIGQN